MFVGNEINFSFAVETLSSTFLKFRSATLKCEISVIISSINQTDKNNFPFLIQDISFNKIAAQIEFKQGFALQYINL